MADTYEQNLGQKSSLTRSDYIRVVGTDNVSYKQLLSNVLAAGGIGELITSSGGWSSDNAKTAFENAYASWASGTIHIGVIKAGSEAAYIAFKADSQYGAVHFLAYGGNYAGEYTRNIYGGTWGDIILSPTRTEINTLNSKLAMTPTRLLSWGTYSNGTYTLNNPIQVNALMRVWIGNSGRHGFVGACPNTGDTLKIYTEDGWVSLNFASTTSVTISGVGTTGVSEIREIALYPSIKLEA